MFSGRNVQIIPCLYCEPTLLMLAWPPSFALSVGHVGEAWSGEAEVGNRLWRLHRVFLSEPVKHMPWLSDFQLDKSSSLNNALQISSQGFLALILIILIFVMKISNETQTQLCFPQPLSLLLKLNQMSVLCHSVFRKPVCCYNCSWAFILMTQNEEGHCRKVAMGKTSGRNHIARIKGLLVQPRGSSECSSEQTNNSLDESLNVSSAKGPHVLQELKEKGWRKERKWS